ncbi:hypothetical protein NM688_g1328 [Phlebia brevispora]|uniref:Uncharacterized protein n=1 Tax=Phlebia brevispora TaxID=194682 RepID=A0ACC1TC51_9APHY|nr:hypothetical protein NM688_g1328 [Phlebia brevispora]
MPPKRSTAASSSRSRKKAKLQDKNDDIDISDAEFDPVDNDEDSDASTYSQPRTKASKKGRKNSAGNRKAKGAREPKKEAKSVAAPRRRNQRGSLQLLLGVPVEIVIEVLRRLCPLDLLRLSRTSKSFRSLLMHRSSSHVWAAAWKNDKELPPCPDGMAAPAFVDLLYGGSWCYKCHEFKEQVETYYVCMVRYCRDCADHILSHTYNWDDIEFGFRPKQYPLVFLVPGLQHNHLITYNYDHGDRYASDYVAAHLHDISEFVHAWKAVPVEGREDFLKERKQKCKERQQHAHLCLQWNYRMRQKEIDRIEAIKDARYDEIMKRLELEGWTEVLEHMTQRQQQAFENLPDVKQKKLLTDRTFQNMLPRLTSTMQKYRDEQEVSRRVAAIRGRIDLLNKALHSIPDDHNLRPSLRDVVLSMPRAREVIDAPFRETVTVDPILEALPGFIDAWRGAIHGRFAKLVRRGAKAVKIRLNADPTKLALAGMFRCDRCGKCIPFEDVPTHYCFRYWESDTVPSQCLHEPGFYTEAADKYLRNVPCTLLLNYRDLVQVIHPIITACGYDPATATIEEVDTSDVRLLCTLCSGDRRHVILTWRAAIYHCTDWRHSDKLDEALKEASEADSIAAKQIEKTNLEDYTRVRRIRCALCPASKAWGVDDSRSNFDKHLASQHNIQEPKETDGFYTSALKRVWDEPVELYRKENEHWDD